MRFSSVLSAHFRFHTPDLSNCSASQPFHERGIQMFKVTRNGANRLDIFLNGRLDAREMRTALDDLLRTTENLKNGKILYTITDFRLPTLRALGIELSRFPSMLGIMRKINRVALLTDREWLKRVAEFKGALLPGIKIRSFDIDQKKEAEEWLYS